MSFYASLLLLRRRSRPASMLCIATSHARHSASPTEVDNPMTISARNMMSQYPHCNQDGGPLNLYVRCKTVRDGADACMIPACRRSDRSLAAASQTPTIAASSFKSRTRAPSALWTRSTFKPSPGPRSLILPLPEAASTCSTG